jgi:hypothetical protein
VPQLELDAAPLDPATLDWLALGGACVAVLALFLAVVALVRLRRVRRGAERFWRAADSADVAEVVEREVAEVRRLRAEVEAARAEVEVLRAATTESVRHVAVVRFDAFGDMGGRLSFAAALLDERGTGIVLTSINGRSETRTYAKGVRDGVSEQALSPEEEQAIAFALRRPART